MHREICIKKIPVRFSSTQEYKRKSKDMETETEDEYILVCEESSGSFSSSVSLSDKSSDNVIEDYHPEAPFTGLCKGSRQNLELNKHPERPKTLKRLRNVYEPNSDDSRSKHNDKEGDDKELRMSCLSPFDEQEEWAKIQEIMASFGTGMIRESMFVAELEKEFQNRLMSLSVSQNSVNPSCARSVEEWLKSLDMSDYLSLFIDKGFDEIEFLNGILGENDLVEMGISSELDRQLILDACKDLPLEKCSSNNNNTEETVDQWLKRIHLEQYSETFAKHLYHDMDRIKRIWDVELSAVLDIEKIGHRKRILASVSGGEHVIKGPKLEDFSTEINTLKRNNQHKYEAKSPSTHSAKSGGGTGTLRHRPKKSRPAPPPPITVNKKEEKEKISTAELFVGGNNSIKAQWRHQPILLITGSVRYTANYLASLTIKDFQGIDSTKRSIHKVRKSTEKRVDQEITLYISYSGVKFKDSLNQETICSHEIKNIHYACQDSECLSYFAYITVDNGNYYYCHVFSTDTSEQATDIILTLGQAFELAYQMALREQVTSKNKTTSRDNHKVAVSPGNISSSSRELKESSAKIDMKMNGHPFKMKSLTLSLALEPPALIDCNSEKTPSKIRNTDVQA